MQTVNWRQTPIRESKMIGGSLCLDFANTVGGRTRSKIINDKVKQYEDLLEWSVRAGVLQKKDADKISAFSKKEPAKTSGVFKRAVQLREAIYRMFLASIQGNSPNPKDVELLNQEIGIARTHEAIERTKTGYRLQPNSTYKDLDRMLWPIAISAADLLTEGDLKRLRQCDGENCGWLFVDTSKNNSRQWCDMSDCGNRAKVRRFRSRQR